MTYGARLRELRAERQLSLRDVEERGGPNKDTMSLIERGVHKPQPQTLGRIAKALGVGVAELRYELEGADHPLAGAPPSPEQPDFNGLLEEERRTQHLSVWKSYLTRRVEWCERVLQKSQEERFLNPFLSLDTAIQWAMYVGIESTQIRDALQTEIRSYGDADSEIVGELRTLLDRFVAVDDTTNARVKAMMDEAGLAEEEKDQRLRLIDGSAA